MSNGLIFWFSGLSGAGKSKIATLTAAHLEAAKVCVQILDGDEVRAKLSPELGFTRADILENNCRIAHYCQLNRTKSDVLLVPLISPLAEGRALAREILAPGFFEIHVACDLDTVMARDIKGLYAKAARGEIKNMIGYADNSPYEVPENPDFVVPTADQTPDGSAQDLYNFVMSKL